MRAPWGASSDIVHYMRGLLKMAKVNCEFWNFSLLTF
eukprot:COSAG05_NODE_19561_length_290_cov_16.403141_1_plen_36_part_01